MKRASSQEEWTIGALARRCGVAPSAIRYYEKQGLLPKPSRRHNWRRYDRQAFDRLQLVIQARAAGFGIREIKGFAAAWTAAPEKRHAMLGERLEQAKLHQAQLRRQIESIEAAMACACTGPESCQLRPTA